VTRRPGTSGSGGGAVHAAITQISFSVSNSREARALDRIKQMAVVVCIMETGIRPNGKLNGIMDILFVTCIWTLFFYQTPWGWLERRRSRACAVQFLNDEIRGILIGRFCSLF
jgi:hypothetical protein